MTFPRGHAAGYETDESVTGLAAMAFFKQNWAKRTWKAEAVWGQNLHHLTMLGGGASYEEVLLRQRQLATGYQYFFSVGLNFTFGSTRSNVVNPRFGNGGRGISISM